MSNSHGRIDWSDVLIYSVLSAMMIGVGVLIFSHAPQSITITNTGTATLVHTSIYPECNTEIELTMGAVAPELFRLQADWTAECEARMKQLSQ